MQKKDKPNSKKNLDLIFYLIKNSFVKYLFTADAILSTLLVFLVIWLFTFIPLNLHVFEPFKLALTDVSFNDLAFSTLKKQQKMDDRVVIINIADGQRGDIARLLDTINTYGPKVTGLDALFLEPKDSVSDNSLAKSISQYHNLVVSEKIFFQDDIPHSINFFNKVSAYQGYINFIGEKGGVIRYYSPFEKSGKFVYKSFSSVVAELSYPEKYKKLIERNHETEWINYRRTAMQYFTLDYHNVLNGAISKHFLKDKIILIGYVNNNKLNIEDKHFTPMNPKFMGKSVPDTNGIIIHANIISMILDESYITKVPNWIMLILAFVFTWIYMAFYIHFYVHKHKWFHLAAKSIQLITTIFFIYFSIFVLRTLQVYFSLTLTLFAIILSVDILYFYEGFARWMLRKFHIKTIFKTTHHV